MTTELGTPNLETGSSSRPLFNLIGIGGLALGLISAGLYLVVMTSRFKDTRGLLQAERGLTLQATRAINAHHAYLMSRDPAAAETYDRSVSLFWEAWGSMQVASAKFLLDGGSLKPAMEAAQTGFRRWRDNYAEPARRLLEAGLPDEKRSRELELEQKSAFLQVQISLEAIHLQVAEIMTEQGYGTGFYGPFCLVGTILGLALFLAAGWGVLTQNQKGLAFLSRQRLYLQELADYAERIQFMSSADQAAMMLVNETMRQTKASNALVLLARKDESGLRVSAAEGDGGFETKPSMILTEPDVCPVMRTARRFEVADVQHGPVCLCPLGVPSKGGYACTPLMAQGRVAGLLNVKTGTQDRFQADELEHAERLARVTSIALSSFFMMDTAHYQATVDPLTEVFNRRFLDAFLDKQVQTAARSRQPLSVLMLDLDGFKKVNDEEGHMAGDEVLKVFAAAALTCVREGDLVGRYGGDEFVVVLPNSGQETAVEIAERIRSTAEHLHFPTLPALESPRITVSIGVASVPEDGSTVTDLLAAVDGALYSAKRAGRNQIVRAVLTPS